jgi:hypothetical protein
MIVNLFATDGMAELGEMNPDLVRASSLQPAAQKRVTRQPFHDLDMGDRFLAGAGQERAAAPAIAAVANQVRGSPLRRHVPWNQGKVTACHGVRVELFSQATLRGNGTRENNQAARVLVDSLYDTQPGLCGLERSSFSSGDQLRDDVFQGG